MNISKSGDDGIKTGPQAADFSLINDRNEKWRLSDYIGNVVVLLFYPQNETLVCTKQLCSVRDNWDKYLETKAAIVGISPGTPAEHRDFSQFRKLPIPLLADPKREITKIYGKHWLFPINLTRAVVVIDGRGVIRHRNIMLRAFRPSDSRVLTEINAARIDACNDKYDQIRKRVNVNKAVL